MLRDAGHFYFLKVRDRNLRESLVLEMRTIL